MRIIIEDADGDIDEIREEVVKALIKELSARVGVFTPSQVCGILDLTPKSLSDLDLDKIDILGNGRVIRYAAKDIEAVIARRKVKHVKRPRAAS